MGGFGGFGGFGGAIVVSSGGGTSVTFGGGTSVTFGAGAGGCWHRSSLLARSFFSAASANVATANENKAMHRKNNSLLFRIHAEEKREKLLLEYGEPLDVI